jgi:hypothetical protein
MVWGGDGEKKDPDQGRTVVTTRAMGHGGVLRRQQKASSCLQKGSGHKDNTKAWSREGGTQERREAGKRERARIVSVRVHWDMSSFVDAAFFVCCGAGGRRSGGVSRLARLLRLTWFSSIAPSCFVSWSVTLR